MNDNDLFLKKQFAIYQLKKQRSVFDVDKTAEEMMSEMGHKIALWMIDNNLWDDFENLKKCDRIDTSALDGKIEDEIWDKVNENWYRMIPPLKEGVLKAKRDRYVEFALSEVDEETHTIELTIADYLIQNRIPINQCVINGTVRWGSEESGGRIYPYFEGSLYADMVKKAINEMKLSPNEKLFAEIVFIPTAKNMAREEYVQDLIQWFIMDIATVNVQLENEKPKKQRQSSGRVIKAVAQDEVDKNPRPQVIRKLSSGVSFKSRTIPKCPTIETVRKYKLMAWNTRGHIRRLKNGKEIYIKPSVHHRHCLKGKGVEVIPQTIIEVM